MLRGARWGVVTEVEEGGGETAQPCGELVARLGAVDRDPGAPRGGEQLGRGGECEIELDEGRVFTTPIRQGGTMLVAVVVCRKLFCRGFSICHVCCVRAVCVCVCVCVFPRIVCMTQECGF